MGMLGPRMECPGSPSATREMSGKLCLQWSASMCLHLLLGGASLAATWGAQWRITCLVTRLLDDAIQIGTPRTWCPVVPTGGPAGHGRPAREGAG